MNTVSKVTLDDMAETKMSRDGNKGRKIDRPSMAERGLVDPNAAQHFIKLRDIAGSISVAANLIGISATAYKGFMGGGIPCRISYSMAAQKAIDDLSGEKNKKVDQFVALVVVPLALESKLAAAILNSGGTMSKISFTGDGVKL